MMEIDEIINSELANESEPMEVAEVSNESIMQPDVEYSPSAPLSQHLRTLYPPEVQSLRGSTPLSRKRQN
ncbi:hypothetical protein J6590_091218 [Homalodisca vitripennis]|nr:hypothetical protein J6590_091218 [Homalodisca vitripennis]